MPRRSSSFGKLQGFTLIELMIVVSVIAVLAAIAIPKFADLIRKSKEGATKGNLGAIRSALSIYYADMEGLVPNDLSSLTVNGKFLAKPIPASAPSYHPDSACFITYYNCMGTPWWAVASNVNEPLGCGWPLDVPDGGDWLLDSCANVNDPSYGSVFVNCTHTDSKGTFWTSY